MRSRRTVLVAVALAAVLTTISVSSPVRADESGLRAATLKETRAFMAGAGIDGPARCVSVHFSRSDERWALASQTRRCGPNSGHTTVYRQKKNGQWKSVFYDMQTDGCEVYNLPASVVTDFRPFVC